MTTIIESCRKLFIENLAFLRASTSNLKGWSMKQSDKTPFFEKEDGVFIFGVDDKRDH
jgi:hypothetical protein